MKKPFCISTFSMFVSSGNSIISSHSIFQIHPKTIHCIEQVALDFSLFNSTVRHRLYNPWYKAALQTIFYCSASPGLHLRRLGFWPNLSKIPFQINNTSVARCSLVPVKNFDIFYSNTRQQKAYNDSSKTFLYICDSGWKVRFLGSR